MNDRNAKKKFTLRDATLASVCVVITVDAIAPAAKMGNSQFFWWIFLLIAFFVPYGLISAELGSAYQDDGGLYCWVKRAYGKKCASRAACYYWFNFPVWVSSIAVLFTDIVSYTFHWNAGTGTVIAVQLLFVWSIAFFSSFRISDSRWILNVAALFKTVMIAAMGGLGIYAFITRGAANGLELRSFFPSLNLQSFSLISVIIFDLMGFEVIATYVGDMKKPDEELPRAIKLGGILIGTYYLFAAFGLSAAVPTRALSVSSGIIESFQYLLGQKDGPIIYAVAVMFLYSLFSNLVSWSLGVNYVIKFAAMDKSLPWPMAKESRRNGMPIGATAVNAGISSAIILLQAFMPGKDLFWQFFAMNAVIFLMSYVMIFPSFIKLRRIDGKKPRPFRVKGGPLRLKVLAYVPMCILIASVVLLILPSEFSRSAFCSQLPLLTGTAVAVILSEIVVRRCTGPSRKKAVKAEKFTSRGGSACERKT